LKNKDKLTACPDAMKNNVVILTMLFSALFFFANANPGLPGIFQDSLPLSNPAYSGYRLEVTDLRILEQEGAINYLFTAINTGTKDLVLPDNTSSVVLNIVESPDQRLPEDQKRQFIEMLLGSELSIEAGAIRYDQSLESKRNKDKTPGEQNLSTANAGEQPTEAATNDPETLLNAEDFETGLCADLVIESVSIVKRSKKAVTLKYKIKNYGKKPVLIVADSKQNDHKPVSLAFYMSSSDKLTRGSIPLGNTLLKEKKQLTDGLLYPEKSMTEEIKLDISKMTRFTPVIILELDPYLAIQECSKTNNQNHIRIK
jgi:hypothetical protein